MAKRLTEKQKCEIVKSFEDGTGIDLLSKRFNCTQLTVVRNLKKNLGEQKYKELTQKNKSLELKLNNKNEITSVSNIRNDHVIKNQDLDNSNQFANVSNSISKSRYPTFGSVEKYTVVE